MYLFYLTLFFRSLHDSRVYFQTFLNLPWNMLSSQSPLQISIWNQWLFTRQNWCELGFCTFFLRLKALWCASTSGEAWAPREDNILPVKPFSWPKHPKVDPTTLSLSRALRILMWSPRMELPARCFPVLLLHDLLSILFSYLVNLLDGGIFFFFSSPRKAMVRCSWKRTLGNTSARSWSFVDSWGQLSSSTSGAYLRMCCVFLSEPRCFMSGRYRQAKLWNRGKYLATNFPPWRPFYYQGVGCVHRNCRSVNCPQLGLFNLGKTSIKRQEQRVPHLFLLIHLCILVKKGFVVFLLLKSVSSVQCHCNWQGTCLWRVRSQRPCQ